MEDGMRVIDQQLSDLERMVNGTPVDDPNYAASSLAVVVGVMKAMQQQLHLMWSEINQK